MQPTIVIPTYNESENLPRLVSALFALPLPDTRILVVDDNSPDGTGQVAWTLAENYPGRLSILQRTGKLGLGTAYIAGFQRALQDGAESIVQMDADFSHPPHKLVEFYESLKSHDAVFGSRYIPGGALDENWPLWRKGLSVFGNRYARAILGLPIHDITGGFRIWRREALLRMPLDRVKSNGYMFQVEMAYLAHLQRFKLKEIPFYFADRRWGQSKMSFRIQVEAAFRVWILRLTYADLKNAELSVLP